MFFKSLFIFSFSFFFISCFYTPIQEKQPAQIIRRPPPTSSNDNLDNREDTSSRSQTSCRQRESNDISVQTLQFIDSWNIGNYKLKGRCDFDDSLIYVTVNGYKTSHNPKCDNGRWEMTLDLTTIAEGDDEAIFHISHDKETICKKVKILFRGPKAYIPIPAMNGYYEDSFFVMKYEASVSRGSSKAVSSHATIPTTRITYQDALNLCRNNGSRYDLMQNIQWQSIALSIESVDQNWSQGISLLSDSNNLNCGISTGAPRKASPDDNEDCATSSCGYGWSRFKRTHLLPNGERIWDMCGNVGEIMKDSFDVGDLNFRDYIHNLSDKLQRFFGPKKTYTTAEVSRLKTTYWNLGYAEIKSGNDLIIRGLPRREAGIFSVNITRKKNDRVPANTGFRCVYHP